MEFLKKLDGEWSFSTECKGKGRNYELTYEGGINKVTDDFWEKLKSQKHAVGDSLGEVITNLVGFPVELKEEDELLKNYMEKGWNYYLSITKEGIEISADHLETEEERYGFGKTIKEALDFTFEEYNPNHPYVQQKQEEIEKLRANL